MWLSQPFGDFLMRSGSMIPLLELDWSDESEPEFDPEFIRVSLPVGAHMQLDDKWIWLVEFDFVMCELG